MRHRNWDWFGRASLSKSLLPRLRFHRTLGDQLVSESFNIDRENIFPFHLCFGYCCSIYSSQNLGIKRVPRFLKGALGLLLCSQNSFEMSATRDVIDETTQSVVLSYLPSASVAPFSSLESYISKILARGTFPRRRVYCFR